MLTGKAPLLLGCSAGLIVVGTTFHTLGAAALGVALLALFAVNALFVVPPRLEAELEADRDRTTEETVLRLAIRITNKRRRPEVFEQRPDLPDTFIPVDGPRTRQAVLGSKERRSWIVSVKPRLFGAHTMGPLRIRIMDPSALRATEFTIGSPARVLVHPRTEPLKAIPLTRTKQANFMGLNEVPQPGDGFEFFTLRQFQSGDSIRSVNWRATARSTGLIVNQRQRESYMTAHILLDARAASRAGRVVSSPFAVGTRAAATLAYFLMRRQDRVFFHIITDGIETIHPQTPERQRITMLDTLATTTPHGDMEWREVFDRVLPSMRAHSPVIPVSSFETDPTFVDVVHELVALEHPIFAMSGQTQWGDDAPAPDILRARGLLRDLVKGEITGPGGHFVDLTMDKPLLVAVQEAIM